MICDATALHDETIGGNWLECILEQVPAMLDQQSAVQSQIVSEMVEVCHVLFNSWSKN